MKECIASGCVYSAFAPILLETACDNPFATEMCTGFLEKSFNKTECLKVTPVCEHPPMRRCKHGGRQEGEEVEEAEEEEEEKNEGPMNRDGGGGYDDNVATVAFCMYDFECSQFCPPKIYMRADHNEMAPSSPSSFSAIPMKLNSGGGDYDEVSIDEEDGLEQVIESFRQTKKRRA